MCDVHGWWELLYRHDVFPRTCSESSCRPLTLAENFKEESRSTGFFDGVTMLETAVCILRDYNVTSNASFSQGSRDLKQCGWPWMSMTNTHQCL